LNFNININCQNDNNISNVNKKETKKLKTDIGFEKEERVGESVYESVLQTFVEKENYFTRLNSKFDKLTNLQSEENDNYEKSNSLYSFNDSLNNIINIKFELDSVVDMSYLKKNLKVLSIKVCLSFN
jgi:hypothetical protein